MRSINGLLSLLEIKLSNLKNSNNTKNVSVTFAISMILLSIISVSDFAGAQLGSFQGNISVLGDTSMTNNNKFKPKAECNEPIDVKNVASSSVGNNDDEEINAQSAFDNDESTEWSEGRVGAFLEFDIGTIRSICDIEILWDEGDEKSYNFVISVSKNGTEFNDMLRATSSGNSALPESYPIPDTMAKHIRLTVYGNSEDETAAIKEISIKGGDVRKVGQEYNICEELPIINFSATPSKSGDTPENAADIDFTTTWASLGVGSFIQADLGTLKTICDVNISWYNGESKQYVFEISVSKDGVNFKQVYEGISDGKSIRPQNYAFSNADAKFVRITVFGNDKNNWAAITELSIKGFTPPLPLNKPPVANAKSVSTDMNVPIPITLSGSDPERSVLTFNIVDLPKHGQLSSVSADTVQYTPDKDYSGPDSFTYNVKDNRGLTGSKMLVSMNIHNKPPVANAKSVSTDMNVPIPITLSGSDPERSVLTFNIVDLPKHGQLSSVSADTVQYTPDKDYSGPDSFTYNVKDNRGSTSAKSTVTVDNREVLECRTLDPAVVTALGSDANIPSNIIDKNFNTKWAKDGRGSWIQFDLGSRAKICSVDIAWYRGDMRQNNFTVSVSDDGSSFKKVFESDSSGTGTGFEKYSLPSGAEGKFVRITVNSNSENNWASITEITLFGVESEAKTPSSPAPSQPNRGDGGSDAGTNDKFGIKKIYSTKAGGEEWYMNMQDPNNDPRSKPPSMSKNSDGSWRVTSDQVRYGVYSSAGYKPDDVEIDHGVIASRGYMQSPNDWKNVEMTGQVKFNSGDSSENWAWYARGGRHTGSGHPDGCEGSSLKGDLRYTDGTVRWAKEQWHVSYVFNSWKNSPASADGKFVGFKAMMYNTIVNGEAAVKLELWVDPNNTNNWQKVYDFIDQGGWGNDGGECNGEPDQIISWGGPIASFRWDAANSVDIKNLSVREILPPQ
jgi:F5/8 type C domain/Bacterial Ig domain